MPVRGIRGATVARENARDAILDATRELLLALVRENQVEPADIVSVLFTVTPDLDAAFPASAARSLGWDEAALLDSQAPPVPNDLPRCIRVLIHWNTERAAHDIHHVYLGESRRLRPDRASGA